VVAINCEEKQIPTSYFNSRTAQDIQFIYSSSDLIWHIT